MGSGQECRADTELVVAATSGDRAALGVLIGRHRPMVLALVRRLLGSDVLAADVVQEATVAALVGLDRLRSPERFGAWYAGIALNVGRRRLRRSVGVGPLPGDLVDPRPGPEERAEAADLSVRVRRVVDGLAPGQRQAVLAFYWQGLTHAEAAIELGISPGAVKARLHQARAALAPELSSYLPTTKEALPVTTAPGPSWVDVDVTEVRRARGDDPGPRPHLVILTERGGSRRLPIYTGPAEAVALACSLETEETPRPMTYQLSASLIAATSSQVAEVRITRLAESTYYAVVVIDGPAGVAEVDARPSDALNLAVVCGAPIRVAATVLDDPAATIHAEWDRIPDLFPTTHIDLVTEVRQHHTAMLASLKQDTTPEDAYRDP